MERVVNIEDYKIYDITNNYHLQCPYSNRIWCTPRCSLFSVRPKERLAVFKKYAYCRNDIIGRIEGDEQNNKS